MDEVLPTSRCRGRPCFVWGIDNRYKPSSTLGPGKVAAAVAFDDIIAELRAPPVVSADAREIAAQLRALADTVRAGRDEWVVATARRAQRQARTTSRDWWPWRGRA